MSGESDGAEGAADTIVLRALQYVFPPRSSNGTIRGTIDVEAPPGAKWTATAESSWISITAPAGGSGEGSGTVQYDVSPNTSEPRQALVRVGDASMIIYQLAAADWLSTMVLTNENVPAITQQGIQDLAKKLNELPIIPRAAGYVALIAWISSVAGEATGIYESFPEVPHIFPSGDKDLQFVMNELEVVLEFVAEQAGKG